MPLLEALGCVLLAIVFGLLVAWALLELDWRLRTRSIRRRRARARVLDLSVGRPQ